MPALANHRHELFAQAIARGEVASAAYKGVGYSATGNAAEACASRLLSSVKIQARVAELVERGAVRAEITVADIVAMLREDRELAHKWGQSGAAVSASLGIAKVTDNLRDKLELTGKDGGPLELREAARREVEDLFGIPTLIVEPKQ